MMDGLKRNLHRIILLLILLISGFYSLWGSWNEGWSNWYYAAAVKSMLQSGHNFFFAAFDPGGFITVDKPPLGLWFQTLSAMVLGFHGWSLILPGALSTLVSILLVYHLVQRSFGKTAGLFSALVMALTPVLQAVSRINNLDAPLIMTLLFAAWALVVAAEKGSFPLLLLSTALVGLGYNIKMLEAYMVLPAFYILYLIMSPRKFYTRVLHLIGAGAVLLAVSLSWSVAVDLTPAGQRPYIGGSSTNSTIELALGYNGIQRVLPSRDTGITAPSPRNGGDGRPGAFQNRRPGGPQDGRGVGRGGQDPSAGGPAAPGAVSGTGGRQVRPASGGGSGTVGLWGGQQGLSRIFNRELGTQISWLLPLALSGVLMGLLQARREEAGYRRKLLGALLFWGMWLAPMLAYFSISSFFHPYYTSILAPGIAALSGIGLHGMWKAYLQPGRKGYVLPAALAANACVQGLLLSYYPSWGRILVPIVCGICITAAAVLAGLKFYRRNSGNAMVKSLVAVCLYALLVGPVLWAYTPILYGISNKTLPYSGPDLPGAPDIVFPQTVDGYSSLSRFLLDNRRGEKYLIAVPRAVDAAPIILETGMPVITAGGFMGTDKALTVETLEELVGAGEIRYVLLSSKDGSMGQEISRWVMEHGKAVTIAGGETRVYDLKPGRDSDGTQ